jgi:hypothetical protein
MSGKKKTHLKSNTFSFQDRGQLSKGKDLDVQYVSHKKIMKKRRKPTWVKSCADPCYESSEQPSHASSPQTKIKHPHQGLDNIQEHDGEVHGDLMLYTDNPRQQTKAGTSG